MIFKVTSEESRNSVIQYLSRLNLIKKYDVQISPVKKLRTIPMNRLYWLWLNCISHETGNEVKDLHEHFTEYYLPRETVQIFNKTTERPISTTKLTTVEFTSYLEKIEQFSSMELGIVLPHPEDLYFAEAYEKYSHII